MVYEERFMNFGETLKRIRKNRQMTQLQVCEGIMPQGTYSRIERGKLPLTLAQTVQFAQRLNVSLNELMYIHQNYTATSREKVLKAFREIELVGVADLSTKWADVKRVSAADPHLQLLDEAYALFDVLFKTEDIAQVQQVAVPIWEKLSRLDHWYLEDLELLNAMLYYFPVDVAEQIVQTALKRLHQYEAYEKDITALSFYFRLNLANLYIGHQLYEKGKAQLQEVFTLKQKMSYQTLSFAYTLQIIAHVHLSLPYDKMYQQLIGLLTAYEDATLKEQLLAEIHAHQHVTEEV